MSERGRGRGYGGRWGANNPQQGGGSSRGASPQNRGRGGRGGYLDGQLPLHIRGSSRGANSQNRGRGSHRGVGDDNAYGGTQRGGSQGRGRGRGSASPGQGRGRGRSPTEFTDAFTKSPDIFSPETEAAPSPGKDREEDRKIEGNKSALNKLNQEDILPLRPGYGTEGESIWLRTNHFAITIDKEREIFKYECVFKIRGHEGTEKTNQSEKSTELSNRKRRVLFGCILRNALFTVVLEDGKLATDYASIILSTKKLSLGSANSRTIQVEYCEVEEDKKLNPDIFDVVIKAAGKVPIPNLLRYLASPLSVSTGPSAKADAIQTLNIIVAQTPNENNEVIQSGHNKFFRHPPGPTNANTGSGFDNFALEGGLIAIRGYYSSVRTSTSGLLLNLNTQSSVFYPTCTVLELMEQFGINEERWTDLERFIWRLRVKTEYLKTKDGNISKRFKTIEGFSHAEILGHAGFDHGDARQITFKDKDGVEHTIARYFDQKHNTPIKNPYHWVLNCGSLENPTWIPPELCEVMPGQPYRGLLEDSQRRLMIKYAVRPPAENARRIIDQGLPILGISPEIQNTTYGSFGLNINTDMVLVPARILKPPGIQYGANKRATLMGASWNLNVTKFVEPATISSWGFLRLSWKGDEEDPDLNACINRLSKELGKLGLGPCSSIRSAVYRMPDKPWNEESIENLVQPFMKEMSDKKIRMALVVLPDNSPLIYNRIKFLADFKYGIHTTCVLAEKVKKIGLDDMKGPQFWANIALKINLKMGGVNHRLQSLEPLAGSNTMIVGIDVAHPSPGSVDKAPSVAAVVASIDDKYAQWPASLQTNNPRQEMVEGLEEMMKERLEMYFRKNDKHPSTILIYRDGVSEGQYSQVLSKELPDIIKGTEEVCGKKHLPKFAIVIAGKRHHTRFYPTNMKSITKFDHYNPPHGTVVDRRITMENGHDFYLQAHQSPLGTAKPTHYVVIKDEPSYSANDIQTVTHALCYLFGRATKAVSLCPPAKYADLACDRGQRYLSKTLARCKKNNTAYDPNESDWVKGVHANLKDSMFYL